MQLIHSYHYFPKHVNAELDHNILKNKTKKTTLLELVNLPISSLYKSKLEKILVKKKSLINYRKLFGYREIEYNTKYNTKVIIDVDINNITKYLQIGKEIPYRNELFNIIKNNNIIKEMDGSKMLHTLDIKSSNNLIFNETILYTDNIVNYKNLYFDTKINRIYLNYSDINKKSIEFDGALLFYHTSVFLHNTISSILSKNTLIVYDNINTFIPILEKGSKNYIIIDKNHYHSYTYGDLIDKIILVSYDFFNSSKYELSGVNNIQDYIGTARYELSLINETILKHKKNVILQALDYDLVIFEDKTIKNDIIINNIKNIHYKKKLVISHLFLKYNITHFKLSLNTYFNIEINDTIINAIIKNILIEKWNNVVEKKIYLKLNKYEDKIYNKIKCSNTRDMFTSTSLNVTNLNFKRKDKSDAIALNNDVCPICIEKLKDITFCKTLCDHYYCYDCISKAMETNNKCPTCRAKIDKLIIIKNDINISNTNMGIKMITILENIKSNQLIISKYSQSANIISHILNNFNINNTLFVKRNNKLEKNENKYNNKINSLFICDYDSFDLLDIDYFNIINNVIFLENITDSYFYIPEKIVSFNITDIKSLYIRS